jgi:hypothetical protein
MISPSFVTPLPYEVDNNNDDISGEEAAILKDLLYPECQSLGLLEVSFLESIRAISLVKYY